MNEEVNILPDSLNSFEVELSMLKIGFVLTKQPLVYVGIAF
jgi:hypothetical protein